MSGQLRLWNDDPVVHNLFLAVKPDAKTAVRITGMARHFVSDLRLAVEPLPPERLHVSLASVGGFSGGCPPAVIDEVRAIAGTVAMAPFKIAFDRVTSFGVGNRKRAIVLAGHEGVAGLVRFQQALSTAMAKARVAGGKRIRSYPT